MEHIAYPLVYFELTPEEVLGILVGTEYQVIEKDLASVKGKLSQHLFRQYKKHDSYPHVEAEGFKMKIFEVKIRPTYRVDGRSFPSSHLVKVPILALFGQSDGGHYECHLPMLDQRFTYYDPKLLNPLLQNFATNALNQWEPDRIYQLITMPEPKYDEVILKINPKRNFSYSNHWNFANHFELLNQLTERYPYNKAVRRNVAALPDAAWELDHKVEEVVTKILDNRANVLLVGNHGVGKSSVLKQAIKKITAQRAEVPLTFWQLMTQRITANARYLGEWQENVETLVSELEAANGVLWIVDVVQLLQTGGEGAEDSIAAFVAPFLRQGKLHIVGEVTPNELESMRRLLGGFVENFQLVFIDELPEEKIFNILDKFGDYCDQNLKVHITTQAKTIAYRLLLRYYPYESFPGKLTKFLGQCLNDARSQARAEIDRAHILDNFIRQTGMSELFLRDDLLLDSPHLQQFFSERVIGQEEAVAALCNIVKIFKAGLNNPQKPIQTMLFAGPTGVGKTIAAKALADYFFGKGQKKSPLVRIDMSEFQYASQLGRFIGEGGEVGKLVQEIRERPFAVLLLDEVEKANPIIFDALMTVLDEGMLLDAFGRVTNFRNTIIIMTSNLGASNRAAIGFGDGNSPNYESAIGQFFRPEFVNRIDQIVTFNALDENHARRIIRKELQELNQREGFAKRRIQLEFADSLVDQLFSIGFDPRYGARPLQRAIEQQIVSNLAKWLIYHPSAAKTTLRLAWRESALQIQPTS